MFRFFFALKFVARADKRSREIAEDIVERQTAPGNLKPGIILVLVGVFDVRLPVTIDGSRYDL